MEKGAEVVDQMWSSSCPKQESEVSKPLGIPKPDLGPAGLKKNSLKKGLLRDIPDGTEDDAPIDKPWSENDSGTSLL